MRFLLFHFSMVLQNHNTLQARSLTLTTASHTGNNSSTTTITSSTVAATNTSSDDETSPPTTYRMNQQRPIIDLLVAMIAVPILILCALQLEKNLHDMANSPESRWLVFALGIGMLIVSVIICGYVTHRMGVCIWAGPIDETGNRVGSTSGRAVTHVSNGFNIIKYISIKIFPYWYKVNGMIIVKEKHLLYQKICIFFWAIILALWKFKNILAYTYY